MQFSKSGGHHSSTPKVAVYRSARHTAWLAIVLSGMEVVLCALGWDLLSAITTFLAICVVYSLWIYRLSKNLAALGAQEIRFTPAWAVASFFIPILNLMRPYEVMTEIWKASNPEAVFADGSSWKSATRGTIITYWYVLWLLFLAAGCAYIPYRLGLLPEVTYILVAVISVLFFVVTIFAIQQLQELQDKKWKRITEIMPDSPVVLVSKTVGQKKDWWLISIVTLVAWFCVTPTIRTYATLLANPAKIVLRQGEVLLVRNDYKAAVIAFDKAISLDPKYAEAYVVRGDTYFKLAQYQKAIEDYSKALELDPRVPVYLQRGRAYALLGQQQKAIEDYSKDIYSKDVSPNSRSAVAYADRGLSYADLGQYQKAIEDFSKAIELDPEYIACYAYNHRGKVYASLGQYQKAIEDYSKAIELPVSLAEAYYNRAIAYEKLGQADLADKDRAKAQELGYQPDAK